MSFADELLMRAFGRPSGVLGLLGGALMAVVAVPRGRGWPDCASRVVVSRGPHGRLVECVCIEGRLSTCFEPGP